MESVYWFSATTEYVPRFRKRYTDMNPIIGMAPFSALVFVLCLFGVFRILRERAGVDWLPPVRSPAGFLVGLLGVLFLTAPCGYGLWCACLHEGGNVTPREANEHLRYVEVPEAAAEVNYSTCLFRGMVDRVEFSISKKGFLRWMRSRGRKLQRIGGPNVADARGKKSWTGSGCPFVHVIPVKPGAENRAKSIRIENGYRYEDCRENDPDSCLFIYYNAATKRAYVSRSRF